MRAGRVTAVATLVLLAGPSRSETPVEFWAGIGLSHRNLDERLASKARLLTERGPMAQLQMGASRQLASGGAVAAEFAAAGGWLDYDGQTQGGVPLLTSTRHREERLSALWRPTLPAAWGEAWLVARAYRGQRAIAATAASTGLQETSTAGAVGLRWRSPLFQPLPGWRLRLEADGLASLHHRVDVDYTGLFDKGGLQGGRRRELALRLVGMPQGAPWDWTLEWAGLRQAASPSAVLYRSGAVAGAVRQPRLSTDDVVFKLTRRF